MQGVKSIFLKRKFSEYSSVVVQYTKTVNSIRDEIEQHGGAVNAGDLELGQRTFNILIFFNRVYFEISNLHIP